MQLRKLVFQNLASAATAQQPGGGELNEKSSEGCARPENILEEPLLGGKRKEFRDRGIFGSTLRWCCGALPSGRQAARGESF